MCWTNSSWSTSCPSSSLRHNYGSTSIHTGPDLLLISRCSSGRKHSGPYVLAILDGHVESECPSRGFQAGILSGTKGAFFQFHYLGFLESSQPWAPQVRHSEGKRFSHVVRSVTGEKETIALEGEQSLLLRRPSVGRKVDNEKILPDSKGEFGRPLHHVAKVVRRLPSRFNHTIFKVRNPRRECLPGEPRPRTLEGCDAKVDEVIAALKQESRTSGSVDLVMEQYKDISKTDISGILKELQQRQDLQAALEFFKWMKKQVWFSPNARQYTRLIGFLGREGKVDLACLYFQEMLLQKCKPDQYTFTAMLNAYGKAKMYDEALSVFSYMKESRDPDCKPTTVTCNALVDSLMKGGKYNLGIKTFMDMKDSKNGLDSNCTPNMVTYNILIDALCKEGHVELAVRVLYEMSEGDAQLAVSPNVATYNTLINACGRRGLYHKAEELMEHMSKRGHKADRITYTALIDAYGKAGLCESAEHLFNGMRGSHIQVDVMAYTAMIDAYAKEGHHKQAQSLFKMMCESGIRPTKVTYLALIEAYGKSGLPMAAKEVLMSMQKQGFSANVLHHSALIDAYGKAGLLEEAAKIYKMMKTSGCLPNLVTLSAILASCSKCKSLHDAEVLIQCLPISGSNLEVALYNLLMGEDNLMEESLNILENIGEPKHLRQSLYNALMDVLWQFEMKGKGARVVALSKLHGIHTDEYHKEEWNIDLHGLSVGGAMLALLSWLYELHLAWLWGEDAPPRMRIITGKGKHSRTKMSALKSPVEGLLLELNSPFASSEEDYGGFLVASGDSVRAWLLDPDIKQKLLYAESQS